MPIKIPRYTSQVDIPGSVPYGQASGAAWAAPYAEMGTGLRDVTRTLTEISDQYRREADKLKAAESAVMRESLIGTVKDGWAGDELDLRGRGLEPEAYEAEAKSTLARRVQDAMGGLQDPMTKALVGKELAQFQTQEAVKVRGQAFRMRVERVQALAGSVMDRFADQAVLAPTEDERDTAYRKGVAHILNLVDTTVLSGEQGKAALAQLNQRVRLGEIRTGFDQADEKGQERIIRRLESGGYAPLPVEQQVRLAEGFQKRLDAAERDRQREADKKDKELAKAEEEERKRRVDGYKSEAYAGTLTVEGVERLRQTRELQGSDYDAVYRIAREGEAAGGRTDDTVYNRFELSILSKEPVSRQAIRAAQANGRLAASGPRSASSLLKMIEDGEGAKDISKNPLFDQGLDDIKLAGRMGKGPLESLTDEQNARLVSMVREYYDLSRSGKFGPEALPEVARKIVDRKMATTTQLPFARDAQLRAQLRTQNPDELAALYKADLIKAPEFNRQMAIMKQLGIIGGPAKPAPSKPAGSKPGG